MRRHAPWLSLVAAMGCGTIDDAHETDALDSGAPEVQLDVNDVDAPDPCEYDSIVFPDVVVAPASMLARIDTATSPPTPAVVTYSATMNCRAGSGDVTKEASYSIDDPLGTFDRNVFTSTRALPETIDGVGATDTMVHVKARGKAGLAYLILAQLRSSGDHPDLLFSAPYLGPADPDRDVIATTVSTISDITAVVSNDPNNPMGPSGPWDASKLLGPPRAMDEGSAAHGCAPHAAKDTNGDGVLDTFVGPVRGAICFEIIPNVNAVVLPRPEIVMAVVAIVDVVVQADGSRHDRRSVLFIVPGRPAGPAK